MISKVSILYWLDVHRQSYFWLAGGLILVALVLAVIPLLRKPGNEIRDHDWWWGPMIFAILAAGRWPSFLLDREFNPDESQLLAGAHALVHDPVFWRAVDAGSSGPLNFFALWPAGLVFGWQTYVTARCTALVLLAITLILAHQSMALVLGRRVARLAGLAAISLEALTNSVDFLHYSTELVPVALLTAACYAAVQRWFRQGGPLWNGLGGLLLGAIPLAKLQAVPLAAVMGVGWLAAEFCRREPGAGRRRIYLMAGAVLPVALFACQITMAGEWWNVILSYFHYNLSYTTVGSFPLRRLGGLILEKSIAQDSLLHLFLPGVMLWIVLMLRGRRSTEPATRIFLGLAFAGSVLAVWCTCYAGRPFLHYWQLTVVPLTFLLGAMTANLLTAPPEPWRWSARGLAAGCAIAVVSTLLVQRACSLNKYIGAFTYFQQHPHTELSDFVAAHARPGDTIAIWGWSSYVYVETGLLQATRDAHFERAVAAGPYQRYFRQRFLADLLHSQPGLFLDSTGLSSLNYQDPIYRHDRNFPALAKVIEEDYALIGEMSGARLYRRHGSGDSKGHNQP